MGEEISIFNSYDTQENRTANYCGLILQAVYQNSPEAFQFLISSLLGNSHCFDILPSFQLQLKQKNMPDLTLKQKSFSIMFETNSDDWRHSEQLSRYIEEMGKTDIKILLLLSNKHSNEIEEQIKAAKRSLYYHSVIIRNITFDELLDILSETIRCMSFNRIDYLYSLLEEFENYLSETGILPRWNRRILIAPCGNSIDEIENGFYACPIRNGDHSYSRAKFFGAYWSRRINYLAEVKAIVNIIGVGLNRRYCTKWNNNTEDESEIFELARERLRNMTPERREQIRDGKWQIFLLGDRQKVDIRKQTNDGLRGKTYWEIDADLTLTDAVNQLRKREWQ